MLIDSTLCDGSRTRVLRHCGATQLISVVAHGWYRIFLFRGEGNSAFILSIEYDSRRPTTLLRSRKRAQLSSKALRKSGFSWTGD